MVSRPTHGPDPLVEAIANARAALPGCPDDDPSCSHCAREIATFLRECWAAETLTEEDMEW